MSSAKFFTNTAYRPLASPPANPALNEVYLDIVQGLRQWTGTAWVPAGGSSGGLAGSDWISYTPTFSAGFGTVTGINFRYRQVGPNYEIIGQFISGTMTNDTYQFSLPNGKVVAAVTADDLAGVFSFNADTGAAAYFLGSNPGVNGVNFYSEAQSGGSGYQKITTTAPLPMAGTTYFVQCSVQVAGLSANVSMAESSTFSISSFLANGTRVTGTPPTVLGQYRSYLRNAGSSTSFTETNGDPAVAPTVADGIKLYSAANLAAGDASNEPSLYEIFVGKNKNLRFDGFLNTGRTGYVVTDIFADGGTSIGTAVSYDPTTGVVQVKTACVSSANPLFAALDPVANAGASSYFYDIVISDNALLVGAGAVRSEVLVTLTNGFGSTNTLVTRWTNVLVNTGSAITYADDASLGGSFTINENGIYALSYQKTTSPAQGAFFITNGSTTISGSDTDPTQLAGTETPTANSGGSVSTTLFLGAGSVIRALCDSAAASGATPASFERFRITKINF